MAELVDTGSERTPLTVVGMENEPVPSPISSNERTRQRRRTPSREKAHSKPQKSSESVDPDVTKLDLGFLTNEELESYKRALNQFRTMLQKLVSGAVEGHDVVYEPPRLTRNPLTKLRRYFEQEPGCRT